MIIPLNNLDSDSFKLQSLEPKLRTIPGDILKLDRWPLNGKVRDPIRNPHVFTNTSYDSYSDITAGDITYYVDTDLNTPFYGINFPNIKHASITPYVDPMGVCKPQYEASQTPDMCVGLSWIRDSNSFRQDIMASNMAQLNQNKFILQL